MEIKKYQHLFYKRMEEQFQEWNRQEYILEQDLYTFLHTLKGTAGTIGLHDLTQISEEKLLEIQEKNQTKWEKSKWQNYLSTIIEGCTFFARNIEVSHEWITEKRSTDLPIEQDFVLVIDDDVVFITFVKELLEQEGFSVIIANNGKRGLELLYELKPAIVFIDVLLPDINGFTILDDIIQKVKKEHLIVTMISADNSKENVIRSYTSGATDFIVKPVDQDVFISYVRNRITMKKEIEQSIIIDELTKMYNRKYMNHRLEQLTQQFQRDQRPFSLAIIDIDFFKKVNDTYGHITGDEVLQGFAELLKKEKRESDIACRYGGEEFVMLFPGSAERDVFIYLERVRKSLRKKYFSGNESSFQITFSAGMTCATMDSHHPTKLLEDADQALYTAKLSGRNKSVIYKPTIHEENPKNKITIIIVDDVYIVREMIVNHFSHMKQIDKYEIEILEYNDGSSFLKDNWYAPGNKYIVLLDVMMPSINGFDVLSKLREQYTSDQVFVSMLTGRNSEQHVMKAIEYGADDFIAKPFDIFELTERLTKTIKRVFR